MRQRATTALVAALLAAACGGGGTSSPTTPSTPVSSSSKLVALDSGNFDTLVLAAPRPSLVKFQSPT